MEESAAHSAFAVLCLQTLLAEHTDTAFERYATRFWLDHLLQGSWSGHLQKLVERFVGQKDVLETWLINRIRYGGQRGFSMSNILGSQALLNGWLQNYTVDWTESLVRTLLKLDEVEAGVENKNTTLLLSHLEKLMIMRDVVRVLTQTKKLEEGIRWFESALQQRKQQGNFPRHYWIMSALGMLYDQQNQVQQSLDLHAQVLALQQATLGHDSLETLWSVNEMGRVYRHLGDYKRAELQHNTALKALQAILPQDHLEITWTRNTLARAYRKNGKLSSALSLHELALASQENSLGSLHPHVLWTRGDIGKCHFGLNRLEEAERFHRQCLEGRMGILGETHVDTLWSMAKLGAVLAIQRPGDPAASLLRRALEGQNIALGREHPQTRKTIADLRNLLGKTDGI
ncbi:hypothetical protein NX059_011400 [Plenodomus lindquistii]|nr:hypothetical protein NX059_011400 [Plenodomus lindquistii]